MTKIYGIGVQVRRDPQEPTEQLILEAIGDRVEHRRFQADIRVASETVDGHYSLRECNLPPHYPGHQSAGYERSTHLLYVLDGTLAITVGDETMTAIRGAVFVIPPRTPHHWWNPSANTVNLLYLCSPGECEQACHDWLSTLDPPP